MSIALRTWTVGVVLVATLVGTVEWEARTPAPAPTPGPAEFSTARAAETLRRLSAAPRPMGSAGARAAAASLEQALRGIAGLEVEVQDRSASDVYGQETFSYRAKNIIARLPGATRDALLVSAHYDSVSEGPGAADNGVAAAALVEVARAAAVGPRPQVTVIFLLDDGEEWGLLGAAAFTHHPWFGEVRAVMNLDAAGSGGKAALFQSSDRRLLDAYARSAPYPWTSVIGQDLFERGWVPSDTDFHVYRDAGLGGIDLALYQDGYAYHTPLDRMARVDLGSLEQVGANTLAVVRASLLRGEADRRPVVYYDLAGQVMVRYGTGTARGLAAVALLLGLLALGAARRRGLTAGAALGGLGIGLLAWVSGLLVALLGAAVVGGLLGRSMSAYASPVPSLIGFGALALAGGLLPYAIGERRGERERAGIVSASAGVIFWILLAGLGALARVSASYLALWWAVSGSLALLMPTRRRTAAALLALLPGAWLTIDQASRLLKLAVPLLGRIELPFPPGLVIAAGVALPVLACLTASAPALLRGGRLSAAVLGSLGVGVLALAVGATRAPYTPDRPLRLTIVDRTVDGSGRMMMLGFDRAGLARALAREPGLQPATDGFAKFTLPASASQGGPAIETRALATDEDGVRTISLRVSGGGQGFRLLVPRAALVGWSLGELPALKPHAHGYRATRIGDPDGVWDVSLRLRGASPVPVEVSAFEDSPALEHDRLPAPLPAWCTASFRRVVTSTLRL